MNSVFNEQPTRKITQDFIDNAVSEASQAHSVSDNLLQSCEHINRVSAANSQEISIYFKKYLFGQNKYFLAYFWEENKYILA